jgi:Predicted metal-dependent hydrolase with the TIM-barrel fold
MNADKIFINGNFITMRDDNSRTGAVAVKDGKIIATGEDALNCSRDAAGIVDLKGYTVVPGFIESHIHIIQGMNSMIQLNLRNCTSISQLGQILHTGDASADGWVMGMGWTDSIFEGRGISINELDRIIPDKPVFLLGNDGHCVWVNTPAIGKLKNAGFCPGIGDSIIARIGANLGFYYESDADCACEKLRSILPKNYYEEALCKAGSLLLKAGITTAVDMVSDDSSLFRLYRKLIDDKKLRVKIITGYRKKYRNDFHDLSNLQDENLAIGPEEYFMDGTLSSRTAMLFEQYEGFPGNRGTQVMSDMKLNSTIEGSVNNGRRIAIHASGDRGVSCVLDVFDSAEAYGKCRNRMEYVEIVRDSDIERFRKHNITAVFQPRSIYQKDLILSRVGCKRIKDTYRIKTFFDRGVNVAFSSNWPFDCADYPEKPDGDRYMGFEPVLGIHAAASSVNSNMDERISPYQALKSYTINAAYASSLEDKLGTIETGKYADMVVLSGDILNSSGGDIINTEVISTIINGEIVYNKGI